MKIILTFSIKCWGLLLVKNIRAFSESQGEMLMMKCKWKKLENGGFNIGLETTFATPPFAMQRSGRLKRLYLLIQVFKNLLHCIHFFFQLHGAKIRNTQPENQFR